MFVKLSLTGVFLSGFCGLGLAVAAEPPEARISTHSLAATVYLPDAQSAFYRGLRFDRAGMIGALDFDGHHYYGPWFGKVDPTVRDFIFENEAGQIIAGAASAATGPAEEFQTPLGYETAKPGETFVKVGVGVLRKADDSAYSAYKSYELVDPGKWSVKRTSDSVEITQVLDGSGSTWKYVYTKTIRLTPDKPELIIEHTLRNTGPAALAPLLYDHNFLTLDGDITGPDLSVTLPFDIKPTRLPDAAFARIEGHRFVYLKTLEGKDRVACGLQGFGAGASDYDIRVENSKSGAGVRIRGDRPLQNLSLWSIRSVMAVEPFIQISAEPGKEFSWKYTYDYYSFARK